MYSIQKKLDLSRPCEYFDLICGNNTGWYVIADVFFKNWLLIAGPWLMAWLLSCWVVW